MAWNLVAHTKFTAGGNGGTSPAIDTTGADLIIVLAAQNALGTIGTPSDNKSNGSPTPHTSVSLSNSYTRIYHWWKPTVGAGHTFTITGTNCFTTFEIQAWSGSNLLSDPFDQEGTATGTGFGCSSGSATPSEDNELVVSACCNWFLSAPAPGGGSGYTVSDSANGNFNANTIMGSSAAYHVQTTAVNGQFGWVTTFNPNGITGAIATFRSQPVTAALQGRSVSQLSGSMSPTPPTVITLALPGGRLHSQETIGASFTGATQFLALQGRVTLGSFGGRLGEITPSPPPRKSDFDCLQTVISQYANSPILLEVLETFCEAIDQTPNIDDFYDFMWNVMTAKGYGLDVWGRIVGVGRTLHLSSVGDTFGFQEATDAEPWNQAPFWSGIGSTTNFDLSDPAYLTLILAKAYANISDGSIPSINQLLVTLFGGSGNVYVTDGEDMTMTYKFEFTPTPVQLAIVEQSGVLPKPAGVLATVDAP